MIDGEYVCDIDISVEEWKTLLTNDKVFDTKSIAALKKWFIEPNHSCTCFDIGKKYDLHSMSANGVINGLGGRVQKELGRFEVKGVGNIASGTKFITVMKSKEIGGNPKETYGQFVRNLFRQLTNWIFLVQQKWPAVSITLTMS